MKLKFVFRKLKKRIRKTRAKLRGISDTTLIIPKRKVLDNQEVKHG